jgi:hypothetical protein
VASSDSINSSNNLSIPLPDTLLEIDAVEIANNDRSLRLFIFDIFYVLMLRSLMLMKKPLFFDLSTLREKMKPERLATYIK